MNLRSCEFLGEDFLVLYTKAEIRSKKKGYLHGLSDVINMDHVRNAG